MAVAILALQGAFIEHKKKLEALGAECFEIRQASDLERPFDRVVLPGGESTTQAKLLHELGLMDPLRKRIKEGMPVLATCAGLILLAETVDGTGDLDNLNPAAAQNRLQVKGLGTMPITVRRNAYGRQLGSFHAYGSFGEMDNYDVHSRSVHHGSPQGMQCLGNLQREHRSRAVRQAAGNGVPSRTR